LTVQAHDISALGLENGTWAVCLLIGITLLFCGAVLIGMAFAARTCVVTAQARTWLLVYA
jgi:hypothetical protein